MTPKKIISLLITILLLQSCTKDVDFNQLDDANINASYIVTLVYFDVEATNFLNEYNEEIELTSDVIESKISTVSQKYLERVEFTVITENSFNRSFEINIVFFDEANNPIYQLKPSIQIEPNSSTKVIIEIPQSEIDVIYNTQFFGFSILMAQNADGTVLSGEEAFKLNLKSSVELFYNYRKV
jgi:hypothetical protein